MCAFVRSGRDVLAASHSLHSHSSFLPPQSSLSRHCFYSSSSTARPTQPHPTLSSTVPLLRFSTSPLPMVTHLLSACLSADVLNSTRSASGVRHCQVGDSVGVGLRSLPIRVRAWLMRVSQMFEQARINASTAAGARASREDGISGLRYALFVASRQIIDVQADRNEPSTVLLVQGSFVTILGMCLNLVRRCRTRFASSAPRGM